MNQKAVKRKSRQAAITATDEDLIKLMGSIDENSVCVSHCCNKVNMKEVKKVKISSNCSECIYADISNTERTVYLDDTTAVFQNGGDNIVCQHKGNKSVSLLDGFMLCSAFTSKHLQSRNQK